MLKFYTVTCDISLAGDLMRRADWHCLWKEMHVVLNFPFVRNVITVYLSSPFYYHAMRVKLLLIFRGCRCITWCHANGSSLMSGDSRCCLLQGSQFEQSHWESIYLLNKILLRLWKKTSATLIDHLEPPYSYLVASWGTFGLMHCVGCAVIACNPSSGVWVGNV